MIQKTFSIYQTERTEGNLFLEIGRLHLAVWKKETFSQKILEFELFQFTKLDTLYFSTSWQEIRLLSKLLDKEIPSCEVILENEDCTLIPDHIFSDEQLENGYAIMKTGHAFSPVIEKNCPGEMLVIYDKHSDVFSTIQQSIPIVHTRHKYAEILKMTEQRADGVYVYFYASYFICAVKKDARLQMIRHFNFQTPEDALYYLLYVRKQMHLAEDVPIIACGMIDTVSALYKTLYSYIAGFQLEAPDENLYGTAGFREYPLHYFSVYCNT